MGSPITNTSHKPRRSRCATSSRNQELARIKRMSIEDRIGVALTMGRRFSWLQPKVKAQ